MTVRPLFKTRLHYIDNLRTALTVLVVLHHVAVTYGNIPAWYHFEPARDASGVALDIFVAVNQAFFMGFFFLIAGMFTPGAHDRKGGRGFLRDRLIRLGIPLLVYLLVLRPLAVFGSYDAVAAAAGRTDLPYWMFYLVTWDPGPMWFVEVLLLFAAVYALYRRRASGPPAPAATPAPPPLRAVVWFTAGLAAVTFLWRLVVPVGLYIPVIGLPTPSHLPQYAALFAVGVMAHRRGWAQALPARARRAGFAAAGVSTLLLLPVVALAPQGGLAQTLAQSVWEAVFAVGVIVGLLTLFRDRYAGQGRAAGFLSGHAFTVYIIHPVVLVAISTAVAGLHAAAIVKFALVAVIALPVCWGLAYLIKSLPHAGRVL
ncbi:acyltransferase [Spongiactinospora rosea]|uniref:Acyltransferase n=1 Tax=Spongiactinospora rosea TaxID=2248750 RepID=A0A366LUI7_9ACTN|nr:acyltransferase [Spongiactinospora rosea]RBQ17608.1 acyltransferase [Spongiactinospora rosea]